MSKNYYTGEGAQILKDQIETYWAQRGYAVHVELVQSCFSVPLRSSRLDLRSNLVNGYPVRKL